MLQHDTYNKKLLNKNLETHISDILKASCTTARGPTLRFNAWRRFMTLTAFWKSKNLKYIKQICQNTKLAKNGRLGEGEVLRQHACVFTEG